MSQQASGSRTYRQPAVVDDSDDDLDDLDDVLIAFDAKPAKSAKNTAAAAPPPLPLASSRTPAPSGGVENDDETSFEADLAGEMEALLKQLAGTHIPGPMPDTDDPTDTPSPKPTTDVGGADGEKALSPEAEEAAWQKAIEMMLSGEGMAALGLDKDGKGESSKPRQPPPAAASGSGQPSFDETIRRTMEQLGSKDKRATGDGDVPPDLAALLAKLGEGGDGDEDELGGLLDGMMSQLMTKEVLEEPMAELAAKYPAYLANPPSEISATDLDKYRKQQSLVNQIVTTFRKPSYSDETDGKEIARLVSEMQDLGGPPKEIMGDLPEGLDLGGGEDCCIM